MPIWIYPEDDKKFVEQLLKAFRKIEGWEGTELYQVESLLQQREKYPQYLATLDPRGVGGDKNVSFGVMDKLIGSWLAISALKKKD